ncbi:MAG TPA: hypothetical protein VE684_22350 [Crenalkalicoccus sp.]|nr:hypothetical protein [Crenalkalicoccus sp.]
MRDSRLAEVRAPQEVRPWLLLGIGLGSVGFLAASLGIVWGFMAWTGTSERIRPPDRFPPPQLQSDPQADLRDVLRAQRAALHSYGWVDRARGIARVPIEEAMRMEAARGADAYGPVGPAP